MLDEELERARLDAETEARRRKRMSREAKEEELTRVKYLPNIKNGCACLLAFVDLS